MDKQTVRDVIGEPEAWPNQLNGDSERPPDMRGAIISNVISSGDQIAIQTQGGACGTTFSVFAIEDRDLHERTTRALRVGVDVHEAVAASI